MEGEGKTDARRGSPRAIERETDSAKARPDPTPTARQKWSITEKLKSLPIPQKSVFAAIAPTSVGGDSRVGNRRNAGCERVRS
jgi:hypothetical protein